MKFVKGVTVFVVLCLAVYGLCALLKRPPQLDIPERDKDYLLDLGIHIQDTQAADTGLSPILSDVEGLAPISAPVGSPYTGTGSSVVPSFLAEPTTSSVPPPFMVNSAPRVAAAHTESLPVQKTFMPTVEVLHPPSFSEPVALPIQTPPELTPFDVPPLETPPLETPPIPITESPPPWSESWDGPASIIPETTPQSEYLQTLHQSPRPLADVLPPIHEQIAYHPIGENIRKVESAFSNPVPVRVPKEYENQEYNFSSSESIPLDVATMSSTRYTLTASRQPLTFEPVKPETSPTAPQVIFAPPKQLTSHGQPTQQPLVARSAGTEQMNRDVMPPGVKPIGTLRSIGNAVDSPVTPPVVQPSVQPTVRETIEQFVQTQRQLAMSGDPDNIRHAYIQLSQLYELEQLDDAERAIMQPVLDLLALQVIYSRGTHILEPPYRVKPGETVVSIAKDFNLTPMLLRAINGLPASQELPTGTTLKVVYGQFDARISVQRRELTLLLGGLYAGRFAFSLSNENLPVRKGEFYITSNVDRTAIMNNGWVLGTVNTRNATIVFAEKEAREIFDILSEQSVIVVE